MIVGTTRVAMCSNCQQFVQSVAMCCSMLQFVALCCSVLVTDFESGSRITMCCSVLGWATQGGADPQDALSLYL